MEPHIQYAITDDEVRIACYGMGDGPPLLVASELLWSHLGSTHGMREYYRSARGRGVGRGLTIIRYDARGTGLSERTPPDFSQESLVADMDAVRRTFGLERFALFGHLNGCIPAVSYAAAYPERVSQLVLVSPYVRGREHRPLSEHFGVRPVSAMTAKQWIGFTETVASQVLGASAPAASAKLAKTYRESTTAEGYEAFITWRDSVDLSEQLDSLTMPTLVIRRESPLLPPLDLEVAQRIRGARLVRVDANEPAFQAWRDVETTAIEQFLGVPVATPVPSPEPIVMRSRPELAGLSKREREVLRLIATDTSTLEMAAILGVSEHTVSRHIANIYQKIGAKSRAGATAYALRYGIA